MPGQDGRVVADAAVLRVVYHLHGDELGAERQNVQLDLDALVRVEHLRQGHALAPPSLDLEHWCSVDLCR